MAYKFQRGEAILSGALLQEGDVEIESGFSLKIGNAEMSEADLEQLDGLTAGTVAASKAIVVDANKDFSGLRNATATGAITAGTSFIIGSADLNEADMEQIDGITAGTVAASKAVVVDSNKDISGLRNVTATGYFEIGSAQLAEADMELIDDLTAGTVAASKAVTVDSNKDTSGFRNVTATGAITAGTSFIIGSADLNEADMEKLDGITNGTAAASKAVVLDSNKDIAGLRNLSGVQGTFSSLTQGRLVTAGSSGVLEDQAALFYDDARSDGYLILAVSSSASGSGVLGDGYLSIGDETDEPLFEVSKYDSGDSDSGMFIEAAAAPAAVAVAGDKMVFIDASDSGRVKQESLSDVRDLYFSAVSGDATIAAGGALTIAANAVEDSMVNDNVATGLAGVGLAASSGVMALDLNELVAEQIASGDFLAFVDSTDNGTHKESVDDLASLFAGTGIKATSAVLSLDVQELSQAAVASGDFFVIEDATDNSTKKESVDDLATLFAGDGLAASSAVLAVQVSGAAVIHSDKVGITGSIAGAGLAFAGSKDHISGLSLDLSEYSTVQVASGDKFLMLDSDGSTEQMETVDSLVEFMAGDGLAHSSGVLSLDLNELSAAAVDVANDSIAIIDANDSNGSKKESIADLVSAMAGAGLTAASGQLKVTGNDVHSKADGDTLQEGYNYFAALDTSGNSATVTLPGSPSDGDVVHVKAGALTNDAVILINRAGSQTIDGETSITLESTFAAVSLVYVGSDAWRIV